MKSRIVLLALAIALGGAAAASAQLRSGTVEINPFGGYLFGGEFTSFFDNGTDGPVFHDTRVDVGDDWNYGGRIGYNWTSLFETEFEYSHTDTNFVLRQSHFDDQDLGDLKIDYFLGYLTFNFGHGRVVPFFTIGAGGAHLDPTIIGTSADSDTRFTAAAGGGLKVFLNPHFGLRFDGRAYSTWLGDSSRVFCDAGGCHSHDWITNVTTTGGFVVAF
jgi:opacity protein-like surface antigen